MLTRTTIGLLKSLPRSSFRFFRSSTITRTAKELDDRVIEILENEKESLRKTMIDLHIKEDEINEKIDALEKERLKNTNKIYDILEKHSQVSENLFALTRL